jgi:hypothetical protein
MSKQPGLNSPTEVIYHHTSGAIQFLEGQILTLIDAAIGDPEQRKAIKDLARPMIWTWAINSDTKGTGIVEKTS